MQENSLINRQLCFSHCETNELITLLGARKILHDQAELLGFKIECRVITLRRTDLYCVGNTGVKVVLSDVGTSSKTSRPRSCIKRRKLTHQR